MKEKVSILICAYNAEKTLWSSVRSAAMQNYRPIEIIVIDDGSNDQTGFLIQRLCERYPEVRGVRMVHQGIGAARNQALKEASGEWILFLDSDDQMALGAVDTMVSQAHQAQVDLVVGAHEVRYHGLHWKVGVHHLTLAHDNQLLELLLKDRQVKNYSWGKLMRRSLLEGIIFPKGKCFEDIMIMGNLFLRAKSALILPEIVYYYTVGETGSISCGLRPAVLLDMLEAARYQGQSIARARPSLQKACQRMWRRNCWLAWGSLLIHREWNSPLARTILQEIRTPMFKRAVTDPIHL